MTLPENLLKQFERTSFCPHNTVSDGTGWNTLRVEFDPGGESDYPSTAMYYDYHDENGLHPAERPFAEWSGSKDGQFVKSVIDWLQTMTQARVEGRSP
jgi:hypothetical protein